MMRNVKRYPIGALLLLVPALIAWSVASPPMQLEAASRLWVKGTSTVRSFECQAAVFDAQIATAGTDAVVAVLAGEKGIDAVAVTIAADKLDCKNGKMNGHMLKAIKAIEHPSITFTLASYELARAEEKLQVDMKGTLTLGGTARDVIVTATASQGPDGTLQIVGSHELSMKDFGLKPPSLMLGTMKVHDKLTVGFDLILKN